jgi:hypothetical protein
MSAGPRVKAIPWLSALPADEMPVRAMVTTAAQAEAEIVERGYCVLRGVEWPPGWLERCRDDFGTVLDAFAARSPPNRGPHRYYMNVPPVPPFLQPLSEPRTNAVVSRMLGEDFVVENLASDTPLGLGSAYQDFHQDGCSQEMVQTRHTLGHRSEALQLDLPQRMSTPWTLIANIGLEPVTAAEGPFEIVPYSHDLSVDVTERRLREGSLRVERLCPLAAGDVVIRNPHAVHRGSPATTAGRPRPGLAYIYTTSPCFATWGLRTHAVSERVVRELEPLTQVRGGFRRSESIDTRRIHTAYLTYSYLYRGVCI